MWQIKSPEVKRSTMDFSVSGQGIREVSQLSAEGVTLINAIELVDWNSEEIQFLVCEVCGFAHCKSGDWVSLRKSESIVLVLPAPSYVWGEGNDKSEYGPPSYLKRPGIPYMDFATYESLRSKHPAFPSIEWIPALQLREATLLFQWNAPDGVLGYSADIRVRQDVVVGSSEGDHIKYLKKIDELIGAQYEDESPAQLRSLLANEQVISLYIDAAGFIEWDALVFDDSEYRLLVDSQYVVNALD